MFEKLHRLLKKYKEDVVTYGILVYNIATLSIIFFPEWFPSSSRVFNAVRDYNLVFFPLLMLNIATLFFSLRLPQYRKVLEAVGYFGTTLFIGFIFIFQFISNGLMSQHVFAYAVLVFIIITDYWHKQSIMEE